MLTFGTLLAIRRLFLPHNPVTDRAEAYPFYRRYGFKFLKVKKFIGVILVLYNGAPMDFLNA
jgi:hypothetical protein